MSDELRNSNVHGDPAFRKAVEKGGPFDVGPNELDDDIGRRIRFPGAEGEPEDDSVYNYEHVIIAVQKDHEGNLCYRVQIAEDIPGEMRAEDDLGRIASPSEVEFIGEEEGSGPASGDGGAQ